MEQIAIIGYSGHAYVCLAIADLMNISVIGYYEKEEQDSNPFDLAFLGSEELADDSSPLFVGIGDNIIRSIVFSNLTKSNNSLSVNLIHPSTTLSKRLGIGQNYN